MSIKKTTAFPLGRNFQGEVVSTKMNKTVVVRVDKSFVHPKYKKRLVHSRRFLVHDEHGECTLGDTVLFCETRPLSRLKRWRFVKQVKKV